MSDLIKKDKLIQIKEDNITFNKIYIGIDYGSRAQDYCAIVVGLFDRHKFFVLETKESCNKKKMDQFIKDTKKKYNVDKILPTMNYLLQPEEK